MSEEFNPNDLLDPSESQFRDLVEVAKKEGRIGGKWRCRFCGMSHHDRDDAHDCCAGLFNPMEDER
jgi:hypothetical protein